MKSLLRRGDRIVRNPGFRLGPISSLALVVSLQLVITPLARATEQQSSNSPGLASQPLSSVSQPASRSERPSALFEKVESADSGIDFVHTLNSEKQHSLHLTSWSSHGTCVTVAHEPENGSYLKGRLLR